MELQYFQIVAQQRMEMLKKQALSLAAHQNKLEDELQKLNDIHNEKKRTIEKNSEEFAERLKKVKIKQKICKAFIPNTFVLEKPYFHSQK